MTLVTEDEAKAKWCPLTFAVHDTFSPEGTGIKHGGPYPCCTTHCMAWREGIFEHQRNLPAEDRTKAGYCGAFGKPESSQ